MNGTSQTTILPSTTDDVVRKKTHTDEEYSWYLWIIIGSSVGAVLLLVLLLVGWLYIRRWKRKKKKLMEARGDDLGQEEKSFQKPQHVTYAPTSYSHTSDSSSEPPMLPWEVPKNRKASMTRSASFDGPCPVRTASHVVQPRGKLCRWNTVAAPQSCMVGTVQPDLYRSSDDEEQSTPPSTNGRIWFSLLYKEESNELQVVLVKAKYLPGRGLSNSPRDPFVKLYLLPNEENFQQSKVRRRTLSPKFNETFIFPVERDDLLKRTLRLSVYDVDKRKIRHSLGYVHVPLVRADVTSNEVIWKDLELDPQKTSHSGRIQIALSCNPSTNKIRITVCRVRGIEVAASGETEVYVQIQLFHGHKLLKMKRTNLRRTSTTEEDVVFDETFSFGVPTRFFDSFSLCFTVFLSGSRPLVKDIVHGQVVVGPFLYARGPQLIHWQEMVSNPRSVVSRWHSLETLPSP